MMIKELVAAGRTSIAFAATRSTGSRKITLDNDEIKNSLW